METNKIIFLKGELIMDENEIMTNNEEIIETATEEVVKAGNGSFRAIAYVGLGAIAGIFIYEYIAKPAIANFKEKRATKASIQANQEVYDEDVIDDNVIDISEDSEDN